MPETPRLTKPVTAFTRNDHREAANLVLAQIYEMDVQQMARNPTTTASLLAIAQVHATLATAR